MQVRLFNWPVASNQRLVSLARTLCSRPDLAAAVIELQIGGYKFDHELDSSPADISMFNTLLSENFKSATQQPPPLKQNDGNPYATKFGTFAALAIAQSIKVEKLIIEHCYWALPVFKPEALCSLTELSLIHGDTEFGFDLSNFQGLLEGAPVLRTLKCHMVNRVSSVVTHASLTTLQIDNSSLSVESFAVLISGFPKLEDFLYSSGGIGVSEDIEATPGQISQALRIRSRSLRVLSLDFEKLFMFRGLMRQDDIIQSLAYLENLEAIKVSASAIRLKHGTFPSAICSLTLVAPNRTDAEDLKHLAVDATEGFPNLKAVDFYHPSDDVWEICEKAFTTRGISCSLTSVPQFGCM